MEFSNIDTISSTNRTFFRKVLFTFNRKKIRRSTHLNIELRVEALILLRDHKPSRIIYRLYNIKDFHFPKSDDFFEKLDKVRGLNKLCFYVSYPNAATLDSMNKEIHHSSESDETIGSYTQNQHLSSSHI
jgi:hypothetical protein